MTATFEQIEENGARVLLLRGEWTVWTIDRVAAPFAAASRGAIADLGAITRLDLAGAHVVDLGAASVRGESEAARRLLAAARSARREQPTPAPVLHGLTALFDRTGRGVAAFWDEALATLSFLGATLVTLARLARHPRKLRWAPMVHVMETAGLNALPIITLLAFFIGVVVAYLGARVLADFGASIFTVELVAYSMLREFGAVITAVLLAGRTDSAFTAEIGAMKMRQEIDALRVIGVDPMEALVAPRVLGMLVMTPVLTFAATIAGLVGGLLVCWLSLGVSPALFLTRMQDGVPIQHFWVGMAKAPVFALVLALVGCRHGLETGGDVASLGKRTTASVVQAIFLVLVLDALFALWFLEMNW